MPGPISLVPGTNREPEPRETGFKNSVIVRPGEVARVQMRFAISDLFVGRCHVLEHEDNEIMRRFRVLPGLTSYFCIRHRTVPSGWEGAARACARGARCHRSP